MQYTLFVILAPLAAITSIVAVVYIGRHRTAPGALALMWAMIAITGWLILNTLELTDPTEQGTLFWAKLEYPFFTLAPVAWLVFAIQYTGRGKWLTPGRIVLLCLVPLIVSSFALTNDWHHLIWKSYTFTPINNWLAMSIVTYGPWFWVFGAYSYSAVLAGAFLIVREYFQSWKLYRQQSRLVGRRSARSDHFQHRLRIPPDSGLSDGLLVYRLCDVWPGLFHRDLALPLVRIDAHRVQDIGGRDE